MSDDQDSDSLFPRHIQIGLDIFTFILAGVVIIAPRVTSLPSLAVYPISAFIGFYWIVRVVDPATVTDMFAKLDLRRVSKRDVGIIFGLSLLSTSIDLGFKLISVLVFNAEPASHSVVSSFDFTNPLVFIGLPVMFFLIVAPLEELLFRYGLQNKVLSKISSRTSLRVIITSLIFAALHFGDYSADAGTVISLGAIFLSSLILGYSYEYTDNLSYPILIHGANNTIAVILITLSAFHIL